jgi:hypothetical protein
MAETMALAMDGRYESYTLGRAITVEQVRHMAELATKHGFKLGGFRSFEREVTPAHLARVAERARARQRAVRPAVGARA